MFGLSKRVLIVIGILVVVVVIFVIQGRNPRNSQSGSSGTGQCQVKVVNANVLNIRSSPATSAPVVGSLKDGQFSDAEATIQNGFRQLNTNQWVSSEFVTPVSGAC